MMCLHGNTRGIPCERKPNFRHQKRNSERGEFKTPARPKDRRNNTTNMTSPLPLCDSQCELCN